MTMTTTLTMMMVFHGCFVEKFVVFISSQGFGARCRRRRCCYMKVKSIIAAKMRNLIDRWRPSTGGSHKSP